MSPYSYLVTPYLAHLQKLSIEAELYGFTGLARGARGLLLQETMKLWLTQGPTNGLYLAGQKMWRAMGQEQEASRTPLAQICQAGSR